MKGKILSFGQGLLVFVVALSATLLITSFASASNATASASNISFDSGGLGSESDEATVAGLLSNIPTEIDGNPIIDNFSEGVGPGDYLACLPYITNTGKDRIYAFITLKQSLVYNAKFQNDYAADSAIRSDGSVPVYAFTVNDGWTLVEEETENGYLLTTWAYEQPLKSGEITTPLCDYMQMLPFQIGATYAYIDDINVVLDYSVMPLSGYEKLSPSDRWQAFVQGN